MRLLIAPSHSVWIQSVHSVADVIWWISFTVCCWCRCWSSFPFFWLVGKSIKTTVDALSTHSDFDFDSERLCTVKQCFIFFAFFISFFYQNELHWTVGCSTVCLHCFTLINLLFVVVHNWKAKKALLCRLFQFTCTAPNYDAVSELALFAKKLNSISAY